MRGPAARPPRPLHLAPGTTLDARAGRRRIRRPGGAARGGAPADGGPPGPGLDERFARAAGGDGRAREALIAANLNLVHHVVRRYRTMGHDAEDLFQVGCVGLVKAVDRFDPRRGFRFSTYAVPLILGEIQRYLRDEAPAGVGRGALRLAQAARRVETHLAATLLRQPTVGEVARALGVSSGELAAALEAARRPASLDQGGAAGEDRPLLARIAGAVGEDGDRLALRQLLAALPLRLRQVLVLRFYLDRSQAEVGAAMGLSQPQVSRLEQQALAALRAAWRGEGGAGPPGRIGPRQPPHTRP
jgi:RNA polymerase sporulation-specific sigma factor